MPTCTVAPSGTSPATWRPMARSTSPIGGGGYDASGSSTSTQQSIWLRCRQALPSVRGIDGFTWAITSGARRAAGSATLTETPRLRYPRASGGAQWTSTQSGAQAPPAANCVDEIEVAHRNELDPSAPARVVEAGRHVPRREAERGVLRPRERIVAEVDAAHQREIAQSLRLAADLGRRARRARRIPAAATPSFPAAAGRQRRRARSERTRAA